MDFDLNDPLGDILSDDSNDSFFNDDKSKTKSKTHQLINIEAKKSTLFGLDNPQPKSAETKSVDAKSATDWLGLVENKSEIKTDKKKADSDFKEETVKPKETKITKNIAKTFTNETKTSDLGFLDDLIGINDSKKIVTSINPRSSISLEDLLGKKSEVTNKTDEKPSTYVRAEPTPTKTFSYTPTATQQTIQKDAKTLTTDFKRSSELKSIDNITKTASQKESTSTTRRRQSNKDWLGLFSDDIEDEDSIDVKKEDKRLKISDLLNENNKTEKTKSKEDVTDSKLKQSVESSRTELKSDKNQIDGLNIGSQINSELNNILLNPIVTTDFSNITDINLNSNIDIEQQSAALCLKQQESHLMVALQLKAQEERLANLQKRQEETKKIQQEVSTGHREQLNRILQGQANHREQLQKIIMQHQQRINNQIQTLLKPSEMKSLEEMNTEEYNDNAQFSDDNKFISNQVKMEHIISILKDNHEREIDLIESSYRKQLFLLNESTNVLEERFKSEYDKICEFYNVKVSKLEQDHDKTVEHYELIVKTNLEKFEREKNMIEEKHVRDFEILQKHHKLVIENIQNSISLEQAALNETKDYSGKLNSIMTDVEKNNQMCTELLKNMETMGNTTFSEQKKALDVKEVQITRMLDNLEKQRFLHEEEVNNRKIVLNTFEERLKQQMQMIDEERIILQKKYSTILQDNEKMKLEHEGLLKQLDLEKAIFKKNMAHTEKTNESLRAEIDDKYRKIEEEMQLIANEKKCVNEMKSEIHTMRMKLEEDLKDIQSKSHDMKMRENILFEKEAKLSDRSKELDILTRSALAKQKIAEERTSEAARSQQLYQDKMSRIQEQTLSLNAREQQMAKEKVALSRERLMLYNQRAESQFAVCNLCKATSGPDVLINFDPNVFKYTEFNYDEMHNATNPETFGMSKNELNESIMKNYGRSQLPEINIWNNLSDFVDGKDQSLEQVNQIKNNDAESAKNDNVPNSPYTRFL